jgi:hypothetical protein
MLRAIFRRESVEFGLLGASLSPDRNPKRAATEVAIKIRQALTCRPRNLMQILLPSGLCLLTCESWRGRWPRPHMWESNG